MRKRLLSMILVLSMMITILPTQALAALPENSADHPFSDVPQGIWYEDAVEYVYKNGLFSGTSDTTFHPESGMSRGMYVTVIGRQVGVDASAYAGKSAFSDVAADAWYAPYVTWAAEKGVVYGTGDGKFSPDALIDRQQMAVLTVRLYDIMGYSLPEPTVTTTPKDIDRIADYAKEAALRLWACGLFAGDTAGNFLPEQTTTRAQAAVFLTRIDNHLIASGVKAPAEKPQEEKPSKPSGGGSGGTSTTYYEVQFAFVDGQDDAGISLPETKTYASGTKITELPTPYQRNGIFLGWYYDAAGTLGTESGDTVTKNMTLYADFADEITPLDERPTPSYFTRRDVGTGFTFQVQAESEQAVRDALTLICVTNGNKEITNYTLSGEGVYTVSAVLEPGQTYKAQLEENSGAVFYENGAMPASIRTLNFITKMEETLNLKLAGGLVYLPVEDVSDMTGTALDGLISLSVADGSGAAQSNTSGGSFSYRGSEKIAVGDTVAIYEGQRPDERKVATDDAVAYVTVTEISGRTYTYTAADPENVLFTPDVLPVPKDADTDGNTEDHSITVPVSTFAYTNPTFTQAGLDETTTPDIGDFIAFYTGAVGARDASAPEYGEIATVETSSNEQGEFYIITYTPVEESVVLDSMDIYSERTENIELSQSQIAQVEADIERQAIESGFVDEAANYLMALAEETDGFQELSESARVRITARTADGTPVPLSALAWEGNDWEWGADDKKVEAHITKDLDHFEDSNGLRAELKLTFSAEKDLGNGNKIGIELEAVFEQEILLSINVSGGAIWKWAWIFPYIYDYRLNANIDVGTYTGIAITAVAKTSNEEEEEGVDWAELGVDVKAGEKLVNIGEKIVDLMKEEDSFLGQVVGGESGDSGDEEEGSGNPLVDKYAEMMGEADESWIELVRKEIFSIEGSVDPFHILVYGFGADFVVSANLYITLGMTFEYGNAKRYNFSLLLFHQQTTSETIDLEEAHYEFVFYVMGTIGVRAGVELEVAVGLLSLKLDSIGITAEVGAYAQLWGYFYYRVAWSQSEGKDSFYSGAMFVEVGIYLEIKFKAQLFSSEKLTYNPTLYENKWPLWSAGQAENVYDFAYPQEKAPEFVWYKVYTIAVPDDAFTMTYMDLTSGETDTKAFDDTNFIITCTNPAFTYDVDTNLLTVAPAEGNVQEIGELNLIWKGGPLSFTSRSINRVIPVEWTDPVGGHYIKFETNGGSNINMLYKKEGVALTQPAAPTKQGYDFAGWYEDDGTFQTAYAFPSAMPDYDKTVYAKWDPATDTRYTVRHYQQNLTDSGYTLFGTDVYENGVTDSMTNVTSNSYKGFTAQPITQKKIAPDGSAVVEIYYDRNEYTATFTYGAQAVDGDENTAPVTYTKKFGSTIYAPKLKLGGYIFNGFDGWTAGDNGSILTGNVTYAATWTPDPNTPYRVEHYLQRVGGSGYLLNAENGVEYKSGPTGSDIVLDSIKHTPEGFSFEPSEQPVAEPKIGADGKTVVKLYYARNSHTVTWDTDGGTEIPQSTCLYNAILYAPAQPSKTGYTFGGWFYDAGTWARPFNGGADTMGMEDITITAKWIPGAGTAYKLERYTQDLDGLTYTLAETENFIGETDSTVNADTTKTITGFTFGENNPGNVLTGAVAADGSFTLKVYYARNTYPITWKGWNDEEFTVTEEKYGATITPPETTPSRTGYEFAGWEGLTDTTTMTAEPLIFTAAWAAKGDTPYTVEHYTEELDGTYSASPAQTEQKYGATAAQIEAQSIVITGFTCDKAIDGTVASGTIAADGTLVLKLYYTRNEYTVTWMGYNGAEFRKDTLKFEQTISKPTTNPTRTGYSFTGWGNVAATMPAQDSTYTAGWSADKYTVTFNANGGTVTPTSKEVTFDQTYGELPTPVLAEHVFQGWYTEDDADVDEGTTAGIQVTSDTTVAITANQTLYAHWQKGDPVKYTVNHYQQNITDDEYTLKENEEREGVVNGMTTAAAKNYGAGFTAQSFEQKAITDSGVVVDIYYTRNSFQLTWEPDGGIMTGGTANGTYKFGADIPAPTVSKTGYTGGWPADVSATMPAGDTTYTASWTANEYEVSFDINGGGTAPASQKATFGQTYGALPTVTRTGYTFDGWFAAAGGGTKVTDTTSVSTAANHTLYAHWTLVEYTITYNLNGGTNHADNPAAYTVEGLPITLEEPTRDGYTFGGWFDNAGLTGSAVTTIPAGSTGSKTFYAKWTGNTVTVTLNNDGVMSGIVVTLGGTYAGLTAPEPKDGRTFQGWYTELGGAGTKVTSTTTVTTAAAHTLYAYWTPNQYTVTLTLNDGTLPAESGFTETPSGAWEKAYTFGYGLTLPVPTRDGQIFGGWYTDNSFTGEPVTVISDTDFGNKSYTAKWESATYTINFELNEGAFDGEQANPMTYDAGDTFTLPVPIREGYTLVGWYDNPECKGLPIETITAENAGNYTLYARWWQGDVTTINTDDDLDQLDRQTLTDSLIILNTDVTLASWNGISSITDCEIDGRGHTVTLSGSANSQGLINTMNSGSVHDLTVTGAIKYNPYGYKYFGGIAGQMTGGVIENCSVKDLTFNPPLGSVKERGIGGLVGKMDGGEIRFTPEFKADMSVTIVAELNNKSWGAYGGLVGWCSGKVINEGQVTMNVTLGAGSISATNSTSGSYINMGGLFGRLILNEDMDLRNFTINGTLTHAYDGQTGTYTYYVGGLAGWAYRRYGISNSPTLTIMPTCVNGVSIVAANQDLNTDKTNVKLSSGRLYGFVEPDDSDMAVDENGTALNKDGDPRTSAAMSMIPVSQEEPGAGEPLTPDLAPIPEPVPDPVPEPVPGSIPDSDPAPELDAEAKPEPDLEQEPESQPEP